MQSRWNDNDARDLVARYGQMGVGNDLAIRTYASRLIGADPALVLHGGGNTSVKTMARGPDGREEEWLHVKGSGADLKVIEPAGHVAVRLAPLQALLMHEDMRDEDFLAVQRANMMDPKARNPSIEILLHAFLPFKFMDHTHADAILSIVNQRDCADLVRRIYGDEVAVVPYIKPGFGLARMAARVFEANPGVRGLLLLHHGIFSFGATARESYECMIELVDRAEHHIAGATGKPVAKPASCDMTYVDMPLAALRGALCLHPGSDGQGWILEHRRGPAISEFLANDRLVAATALGPATPDHVIWTKRRPLVLDPGCDIGAQVDRFARQYEDDHLRLCGEKLPEHTDPLPRVALLRPHGLVGIGRDAISAGIAADLFEHNMRIIMDADALGRFSPLDERRLFDMEFWSFERAKLGNPQKPRLAGRVVMIHGAGVESGRRLAMTFATQGAHLILGGSDEAVLEDIRSILPRPDQVRILPGQPGKASTSPEWLAALSAPFGGLDLLVDCTSGTGGQISAEGPLEITRGAGLVFQSQGTAGMVVLAGAGEMGLRPAAGANLARQPGLAVFHCSARFGDVELKELLSAFEKVLS